MLACSRAEAGRFARNAEGSLRKRLRLPPFERARIRPVVEQSHLRAAVLYVLRQAHRHGSSLDPAHEGSSLPDLLGFRVLDSELPARLRAYLPRLRVEDIAPGLVQKLGALSPSLELLADAAAAAIGVATLMGRQPEVVAARRAAVHVVAAVASAKRIGELLHVEPRVVRRHLREQPDARLVTAIGRQLRLQTHAAAARAQDLLGLVVE